MKKKKLIDLLIVFLLSLSVFFVFRLIKDKSFFSEISKNQTSSEVSVVTKKGEEGLSERRYPPHFTEEMILSLVPQTDEVGKEEHRRWDETLREIAEEAETLRLYKYEEDCFGDPLVIRMKRGESISVENDTDSNITLGMGEQSWKIEAGGTIEIKPEFKIYPEFELEENPYGYGCGGPFENAPSGLFLVR